MTKSQGYLLIILQTSKGEGLDSIKIQKLAFLIDKTLKLSAFNFVADAYGPFDPQIFVDLAEMQKQNLVWKGKTNSNIDEYHITLPGSKLPIKMDKPEDLLWIQEVVLWGVRTDWRGIVRAVLEDYPEYRQ